MLDRMDGQCAQVGLQDHQGVTERALSLMPCRGGRHSWIALTLRMSLVNMPIFIVCEGVSSIFQFRQC